MNKYNGEETKYKRFAAKDTAKEISQILLIGLATVKGLSYLRNQAKTNIRKYIDERKVQNRKSI
jgi:hypothetical protein